MSWGSGVKCTEISAASPEVAVTIVQLLTVGAEDVGVVIWLGSGERKVTSNVASCPTQTTIESHTDWLEITGGTLAEVWSVVNERYLLSSQLTPSLEP